MTQKILIMESVSEWLEGPNLRERATSWRYENPDYFADKITLVFEELDSQNLTNSQLYHTLLPLDELKRYATVLQAMADGWVLLGLPRKKQDNKWEWWLTKG